MQQIITQLLMVIERQKQIINFLCILVFGNNYKRKLEKCTDKKYLKLPVDPLPIFGKSKIETLYGYKELIKSGNIKPVRCHGGKLPPVDAICAYCGTPHEYVYDNSGHGTYWCKGGDSKFTIEKHIRDDEPYCPFCESKLLLIKTRKTFDIYCCHNIDYTYRKCKLSAMDPAQKALVKASLHISKLDISIENFNGILRPFPKIMKICRPLNYRTLLHRRIF